MYKYIFKVCKCILFPPRLIIMPDKPKQWISWFLANKESDDDNELLRWTFICLFKNVVHIHWSNLDWVRKKKGHFKPVWSI